MKINSSQFDILRVLRTAAIISVVIWYAMQWVQMISNPISPTGADFIHFYTAGQFAQKYGYPSVYNVDLQQKTENEVAGFQEPECHLLPTNHLPYLIPVLQVVVDTNYAASFIRWVILLLIFFITGNLIFLRSILSNQSMLENLTLLGGAIIFYPFFISLLMGQDSAILYFGGVLLTIGILKKNDWLAGVGLAFITVRPQIFLVLVIPLFLHYRRVWWQYFIPTLVLAMFSVMILGLDGTREFINVLLLTASGSWYCTNQSVMFNLLGLTLRIFTFVDEQIIGSISWVGYVLGIIVLSVRWLHAKDPDESLLGLSILAALFFAPHLHYHDLTLLIIPILLTAKTRIMNYSFSDLATLLVGISSALFISAAVLPIYFILPYILYFRLAWTFLHKRNDVTVPKLPDNGKA